MATKLLCTSVYQQESQKPNIRFKCLNCDVVVCKTCAEKCHRPHTKHEVVFHGRSEYVCGCYKYQREQSKSKQCSDACDGVFKCLGRSPAPFQPDLPNIESESFEFEFAEKDWCSYLLTGTYAVFHELYECRTCGILARNNHGVCESCLKHCHRGHDVGTQPFVIHGYCACGAGCTPNLKLSPCLGLINKQKIHEPPKIGQHSGVAHGNSLYFFGGAFDYVTNDLFEFNFVDKQWYKITQRGDVPGIRSAHCAAVHNDSMYIFGGVCGQERYNSVYRFDFSTYSWTKLSITGQQPSPKYFTAIGIVGNDMYVFGGMLVDDKGDKRLFKYSLESNVWIEVLHTGDSPPRINGCSMAVFNNRLYVFGGFNHDLSKFSDILYEFDVTGKKWSILSPSGKAPFRRAYHTAIVYREAMYVYGGKKPGSMQDSECLYEYRFAENKWYERSPNEEVPNVFFHAAAVAKNSMYVLGGNNRSNIYYGFYEYNFLHEKWFSVTNKSPTSVCDNLLKKLFLDGKYYDSIIRVDGGHEFKVHACILSQCLYLKELIENKVNEVSTSTSLPSEENYIPVIHLRDIKPKVLRQVLLFLYGSEKILSSSESLLLDVFVTAKQMRITALAEKALSTIDQILSVDNVLPILQKLENYSIPLTEIRHRCLAFTQRNYVDIVSRDDMENLSRPLVLEIARLKTDERSPLGNHSPKNMYIKGKATSILLGHLKYLRRTGDMSDVTLVCMQEKFKAHRAILACSCDYFASLFSSDFQEGTQSEIEMPNVSPNVLEQVLDFAYMGQLSIPTTLAALPSTPTPTTPANSCGASSGSSSNCSSPCESREEAGGSSKSASSYESPIYSEAYCNLLLELSSTADMLTFKELEEVCKGRIIDMIQPENVCMMLQFCAVSEHKLKNMIRKTCKEVLRQISHEKLVDMFMDSMHSKEYVISE